MAFYNDPPPHDEIHPFNGLSSQQLPGRDRWPDPDMSLLGNGRRPAQPFPVKLLGSFWSTWAQQAAVNVSAPVDYVAAGLLANVAALLGNVRWPSAGAEWKEPPCLWLAVVGSPSSGKSPAIDASYDLLQYAEELLAAGFDLDKREYELKKQVARASREIWEKEVSEARKGNIPPPPMPDDAEDPDEPLRPRVRVADATTESLGVLAAGLPRGLLLVRDELSGWFGAFDRYGGGGSDRAFALESYGGRSYVIDRRRSPEPIRISHLSIGIVGGIQPDKLTDVLDTPDDGLVSRFLWLWPDAIPSFRLSRDHANNSGAQAAFGRLASLAMNVDQDGHVQPRIVPLSNAAEAALEIFAQDMQARAENATGPFAGAIGKARGHCLRLSAVLEYLIWSASSEKAEPTCISEMAVKSAAGLIDGYFLPMAQRAFGDAAIPKGDRLAMTLAKHIRAEGLHRFNAREVRRTVGGSLREPAAMDAACDVLVEGGLIREAFSRAGGTYGKRAKNFIVNPTVFGGKQ
ncbi:DUF3987 domain-containing protein [Methylocella sp. CPCC 101449]|uniref:DUF3987 domain-containing protein n=1 Tax=Methylocella sp. CPCC 101449 TaxID=2987531 RepID=UPI00288CFD44|nr:DUF3987 domain-containing protein [Methylocella sp. CPCC 101449]MDT2024557.1 YfjI family protein [Methylocella sp. CPCC 101449]